MKTLLLPLLAMSAITIVVSTKPPAPSGKWEQRKISRYFWAEGACAADVNGDGNMDVLSGPYWYQGPDFKVQHDIYPDDKQFVTAEKETIPGFMGELSSKNGYSDNFISYTHDFNNDGKPDYLVIGFPSKETFWYENPGKTGGFWKRHIAIQSTDNESPMLVDINGDKQPDLLCMSGGQIGYASYDPADPTALWKWNSITDMDRKSFQRFTHGIGYGDINSDGLTDILEKRGWWEHPKTPNETLPWKFHPVNFGEKGGAQMFGYDVNGDGRTDVISSLDAHGFGVCWFEQHADGTWKTHLLTDTPDQKGSTGVAFTQPHALDLADINNDGTLDIITGKRFWAHGPTGDVEPDQSPVIYAFLLKRTEGKANYTAEIIDAESGVGCQVMAKDINGDNRTDIVSANKKGCFVIFQK